MLSNWYNVMSVSDSLQTHIGNLSFSQTICLAKRQIMKKGHRKMSCQFVALGIAVDSCLKCFLVLPCLSAQTADKKANKLQVKK